MKNLMIKNLIFTWIYKWSDLLWRAFQAYSKEIDYNKLSAKERAIVDSNRELTNAIKKLTDNK